MTMSRAGLRYFALVFGAGFVLGAIRVPLVVPRLGERLAELIEMPFLLAAIVVAARHVVGRFAAPPSRTTLLGLGFIALGLLIAAEVALAVVLARQSLRQYIASRDPVSFGVYLAMLLLFALMPYILGRRRVDREGS